MSFYSLIDIILEKIRKLFEINLDSDMDLSPNENMSLTDEDFVDCQEYCTEEEVVSNNCKETEKSLNDIGHQLTIDEKTDSIKCSVKSKKTSIDWAADDSTDNSNALLSNDCHSVDTKSDCSSSSRLCKKSVKESNRLLEKWGESIDIYDSSGAQKRLIALNELHNYFELKLSSLNGSDCLLLCSLINSRYPRFYTSTVNYYQRWRMRYNIFVASDALITTGADGELSSKPISSAKGVANVSGDHLVLHMGEIHLYFDIIPKYSQPVYVNSSFYANKCRINSVPNGHSIVDSVLTRITKIVNSIRYSKDIFQFNFPLNAQLFYGKTELFNKFIERQTEFIEESIKVFRKNEQKKRKFHNWSQRFETRDVYEMDYESQPNDSIGVSNNRGFGRMGRLFANQKINKTIDSNEHRMEWNDSSALNCDESPGH